MAAARRDARGRGLRDRVRAGARCETIFEIRLLEVDDAPAARRRTARSPGGGRRRCCEAAARAAARSSLGPGLGRSDGAVAFARALAPRVEVAAACSTPTASTRTPGASDALASRAAPTVLTPHAGELGRLLGVDVRRGRAPAACTTRARPRALAARSSCSRATTRSSPRPDGRVARQPAAARPALATAGTGDVLSGVIAALLARGMDAVRGGAAPACICTLRAGRRARGAARRPTASSPRDVIAALARRRSPRVGCAAAHGRHRPRRSWMPTPVTVTPETRRRRSVVPTASPSTSCPGVPGRQRGRPLRRHHHRERPRDAPTTRATCTCRTTSSCSAASSSSSRMRALRGAPAARRWPRRPRDMMTEDPTTVEPDATRAGGRRALIARSAPQPAPGRRARPARRPRHARRRARRRSTRE